jgi:hypothetical protein
VILFIFILMIECVSGLKHCYKQLLETMIFTCCLHSNVVSGTDEFGLNKKVILNKKTKIPSVYYLPSV